MSKGNPRLPPRVRGILRRIEGTGGDVRSSAPRARVVEGLFDVKKHFTLEDLQAVLAARGARVGYATVYRTLRLLAEHGVLAEVHFEDDVTRYELTERAAAHHDHLICDRCGIIVEFEEPAIESLQEEVAARHGYVLRSHVHQLYGLCPGCSRTAQ